MTTISRRALLSASLSAPLAALIAREASAAAGKMTLALHQNTSSGAGYRKSLEGWARAGITQVELTGNLVDEFLKTDTVAAARQVLSDLGLTPVHASIAGGQLIAPNDGRGRALESLKRGCETFAQLGLKAVYTTTGTTQKVTADDYKAAAANIREAGDVAKQFGLAFRIEFLPPSAFLSTLPTIPEVTRDLQRVAAWSMVQEGPEHAAYGWSHCLTMPQAVLAVGAAGAAPARTSIAVAATHVVGFRSALSLDSRWSAHHRKRAGGATRAPIAKIVTLFIRHAPLKNVFTPSLHFQCRSARRCSGRLPIRGRADRAKLNPWGRTRPSPQG